MDDKLSATITMTCRSAQRLTNLSVHVDGLSYWYGHGDVRTPALTDVCLEVERGEVVILTGPSGSGKTTLLTIVGALRKAGLGYVKVLGHNLVAMDEAEAVQFRRDIGFIFQSHNLFDSLSAIENVRMATALRPTTTAEMNRRAAAMLTRIGMGERLHHLPSQLSGGQSQRVAIARALVNSPSLVLADEPTASLDASSGQEVLNILHELADGPTRSTILIVTHDQRVLDRADRIVNLVGGHIVSNVMPQVSIRICKTLQKLPILEGYSSSMLAQFADNMFVEVYRPGEVITREGSPGDRSFVISQGVVEQLRNGTVLREMKEGDNFGQLSVTAPHAYPSTVRAKTDVEVFVMTRDRLLRVMAANKAIDERIKIHLMNRQ